MTRSMNRLFTGLAYLLLLLGAVLIAYGGLVGVVIGSASMMLCGACAVLAADEDPQIPKQFTLTIAAENPDDIERQVHQIMDLVGANKRNINGHWSALYVSDPPLRARRVTNVEITWSEQAEGLNI